MDDKNKALEDAANAMNEAATAPVEAKQEDVKVEETVTETPAENAAEEMKAEPAVEPAKEAVEAAPVTTETPATQAASEAPIAQAAPVVTAAPAVKPEGAKKSKKGLIIGIAAGVLVAGAAGGFGIAYAIDSKPENIAMSAVADFLGTKAMSVSGVLELSSNSKNSELESARIDIKNDKNAQNETNTSATLTVVYGGEEISISVGSVVLKDYTIYIQLSGLKEAVKQAIEASETTGYADYAELYEDLIDTVVGEVDGVWWKIYIPDVVDAIDEISSSDKKEIKEAYQCFVDSANNALAKQDKYVDIYKNNAFVSLEEYKGSGKSAAKGTPYKVKLDASKLTSYANAMTKEADSLGFDDCMKKVSSSYSSSSESEEIKEEDIKKSIEDFPEIIVTIENGFFSHKINGIYYASNEDDVNGKIDIQFSRDVKAVSAPSGAKDITDLYDSVMNAYTKWQKTATCKAIKVQYPTYYTTYCDPQTNTVKPQYEAQFKSSGYSPLS